MEIMMLEQLTTGNLIVVVVMEPGGVIVVALAEIVVLQNIRIIMQVSIKEIVVHMPPQ